MKSMKFLLSLMIGGLLLTGCEQKAPEIGCEKISLRGDCLSQIAEPLPAPEYGKDMPGSSTKMERAHATAPPKIPHDTTGFEITRDNNACMMCHTAGMGMGPSLPMSHLEQPKVVLGQNKGPQYTRVMGTEMVPDGGYDRARHFCTQCHVPQANNLKPLVVNKF